MVYLSVCLCHLQFLLSVSYSFQSTSLFVPLDKFIPRYFILFDAMVSGIVSLISLSDFSLLVYRHARDSCILTVTFPVTTFSSVQLLSRV